MSLLMYKPYQALVDIGNMKDGWNGEGTRAPSNESAEAAMLVLEALRVGGIESQYGLGFSISPSDSGDIWFEWQSPCSLIIAIESGDSIDVHFDDLRSNGTASQLDMAFSRPWAAGLFAAALLREFE